MIIEKILGDSHYITKEMKDFECIGYKLIAISDKVYTKSTLMSTIGEVEVLYSCSIIGIIK